MPPPWKKHKRSTAPGEHRPVMLAEVREALGPQPGEIVVDCTAGWAGHAVELVKMVGPTGRLIALDCDAENLDRARPRLEETALPFTLHHANFAGLQAILGRENLTSADMILADLGMSSMQVDDAERGFSYVRDGPLDMRMDRGRGRSAAEILATISSGDLAQALHDFGDEPQAESIARAFVKAREQGQIFQRTSELARFLSEVSNSGKSAQPWRLHPQKNQWNLHPAARTFQALRILVNRELANLENLLRVLPTILRPAGRVAIISFHSGEDRLVKNAFRSGQRDGIYDRVSTDPIRASFDERVRNPRSRSAKLRWARRAEQS